MPWWTHPAPASRSFALCRSRWSWWGMPRRKGPAPSRRLHMASLLFVSEPSRLSWPMLAIGADCTPVGPPSLLSPDSARSARPSSSPSGSWWALLFSVAPWRGRWFASRSLHRPWSSHWPHLVWWQTLHIHLLLHLQVRICQVQQAAIWFDLPFTIGSCLIASEAALNFSWVFYRPNASKLSISDCQLV